MRLRFTGLLAMALFACLPFIAETAYAVGAVLSTKDGNADSSAVVLSTESVRKHFAERFPGVDVTDVKLTPFPGLFEVQLGGDLLYADAQVNYLLHGILVDAKSGKDLTSERLEKLVKVSFSDLPLELAVKQVKGNGSRKMAIFEDPNCGYCKLLHETMKDIDNITVYSFLLPVLSPDSEVKARNVWCAKDQAATWRAWMLDGETPPTAVCNTPVEAVLALGKELGLKGTPSIVFSDGSRINRALSLDELQQKLDSLN